MAMSMVALRYSRATPILHMSEKGDKGRNEVRTFEEWEKEMKEGRKGERKQEAR